MSDQPDDTITVPDPKRIRGAKIVDGQWVSTADGTPLTNADLQRLRKAEADDKAARARERKQADKS
jgi:hypothetical protein